MPSCRWLAAVAPTFLVLISNCFGHEPVGTAPGMAVTPDGTIVSASAHATGWVAGFIVKNTGTTSIIYRVVANTWRDSLVYDAAGNLDSLVSKKAGVTNRWGYDWDVLNRLVTVRRNGTLIARYAYDVLGRRIAKRVYSSATGGAVAYTRFVYQGEHVAFEADSGVGGIKIWKRYVWGMGTDDLIAVRDSTSGTAVQYYAVKDKLGSVRGLVKRDGTWQYSERFAPYGAQMEVSGSDIGLRYKWTGREYDAETGFYYFRARYYEPQARRFVSEDPSGYAGGSENLFSYVGGAVLEARDPSGLLGVWADNYRGFRSFCTPSGSCLGADGSVSGGGQDIYIDGINAGAGGGSLLAGLSIKAVHTGKLVDLVWASQKAVWHIDFQSSNSRVQAERCVRSSQVCATALTQLDALAQKFPVLVAEGDLSSKGTGDKRGGFTQGFVTAATGDIHHISIAIDPNGFGEVNQGIGGIGWSYNHTLVHEAGHAIGWAEGFNRGLTGSALQTHHWDAALAWENAYRFEQGLLGHGYSVRQRATHLP